MWKWALLCWVIKITSLTEERRIRWLRKLRTYITREIDQVSDSWSFTEFRPKVWDCPDWTVLAPKADLAVVMQGPLRREDAFTEQTLRLYRKTFPTSPIIYSTWNGEHEQMLERIAELGVTVLTNDVPEMAGPYHVNYQLASARAGVEEAAQLGCEFILKCRSDVRFSAPNMADYLAGLWRTFPTKQPDVQRGRLIVLDLATRLYIPHHLSDMMMFGHRGDMLAYWTAPESTAEKPAGGLLRIRDLLGDHIPEIYLCESYLKRDGSTPARTIEHWWKVLAEQFLVIDRSSVGFTWPKHYYDSDHQHRADDDVRNLALCSFRDWMNLATVDQTCPITIDDLASQKFHAPLATVQMATER